MLFITILYSKDTQNSRLFILFDYFCKICCFLMLTRLCQPCYASEFPRLPFSTFYQYIGSWFLSCVLNVVMQENFQSSLLRVNILYLSYNFVYVNKTDTCDDVWLSFCRLLNLAFRKTKFLSISWSLSYRSRDNSLQTWLLLTQARMRKISHH